MIPEAKPKRGLLALMRRSAIFAACDIHLLGRLAAEASVERERRGYVIAERDTAFPFLEFVCEGIVGVVARAEGPIRGVRRFLLYEAAAGSTFGEIAVLDRSLALGETIVVSKHATYALIPADRVMAVAQDDPAMLQRLGTAAAFRCRGLATRISDQHAWPVTARVARVLLPFASAVPGLSLTSWALNELTQRDVAAAAGCVPEAAARSIAELERRGAVKREHGRIRYADRERLRYYSFRD